MGHRLASDGLALLVRRHRQVLARVLREVYALRVFRFFGEVLRQAGILILARRS